MQIVAERIKELRLDNGKTQMEIATLLRMDRSNYGKYEQGKLQINIYMLRELAKFYNVTTDYLLGLTDDYSPKN